MSTRNISPGASYAVCPNCGAPLHQANAQFDAVGLGHRLPRPDGSLDWQHPGSSMRGQCPRCGQTVTFQHMGGQTGFSQ